MRHPMLLVAATDEIQESRFALTLLSHCAKSERPFECAAFHAKQPGRECSPLGDDGTPGRAAETIELVGATGFEPATFRPPAERRSVQMFPGASGLSDASGVLEDLDK